MKISVVIPSYNSAKWLPATVASVRAQIRPADELLVVDDGSTDDTAEVTARLGVRCVRRQNGGLSAARNTGIAETTGEWMLFLDADDELTPDALLALSKKAESSAAGVVYGFVIQRRAEPTETRLHGLPYAVGEPPHPAKAHFWWTPIPTAGAALIRRSLNDAVGGFDENFRQVEDAEYWLRCGVTSGFAHCDSVVLDKRYSAGSLGQQEAGSIWFRLQLQLKFLDWSRVRGIDTKFLEATPDQIIDHALTRIDRAQAWQILEPVLQQAGQMGVRSAWVWRSYVRLAMLRALGRVPVRDAKFASVWDLWRAEPKS